MNKDKLSPSLTVNLLWWGKHRVSAIKTPIQTGTKWKILQSLAHSDSEIHLDAFMVSLIRAQSSTLEMVLRDSWPCPLNNLSPSVRIILFLQLSSILSLLPAHNIKASKALFQKLL